MLDDAQVMGDEEVGQAVLALQLYEQVQDLRLDRDVEGARRLVQHHEVGLQGDGAGDGDALPLAPRELVWVAEQVLATEADALQQRDHPFVEVRCPDASLCTRNGRPTMSLTSWRGFSEAKASWKTTCVFRR